MNKVLVLGANGFTGRHFIRWARENDHGELYKFIGASFDGDSVSAYDEWLDIDITDSDSTNSLFDTVQPDYLINLAGLIRSTSFPILHKVNSEASYSMMDYFASHGKLKRMILIGSAAEYGIPKNLPLSEEDKCRPLNPYGLSKQSQTQYAQYFTRTQNLPVSIVRTFNIIGSGMPDTLAIGAFASKIKIAKDGDVITTGDLSAKRDYLAIDDVCDAYWKLLTMNHSFVSYNLCSGKAIAMDEILKAMILASGKNIKVEQNHGLTTTGKDVPEIYGDNSRLMSETGWLPKCSVLEVAAEIVQS